MATANADLIDNAEVTYRRTGLTRTCAWGGDLRHTVLNRCGGGTEPCLRIAVCKL